MDSLATSAVARKNKVFFHVLSTRALFDEEEHNYAWW